jgi:hypothetical protein
MGAALTPEARDAAVLALAHAIKTEGIFSKECASVFAKMHTCISSDAKAESKERAGMLQVMDPQH